nr:MAG TPA: hypothetical protein [Bacteriophage sp.]
MLALSRLLLTTKLLVLIAAHFELQFSTLNTVEMPIVIAVHSY